MPSTFKYLYFTPVKWEDWLLAFILIVAMKLSVFAKKLTPVAALTGGVLGVCVYVGAGFTGIALLASFFILGTAATSWQRKIKQVLHIEENNSGQRKWSQVVANAGVAALLGLFIYFFPQHQLVLQLMMAASFSSATADTLSSELGNVYGKRFYNILSFTKDERGRDGVVSLEGTLAGVTGSVVIALIAIWGFGWHGAWFLIVVLAGTVGNLSDSVLGAAFERKALLQNDAVNFLNTLVGALIALLCYLL